MRDTYPTGRISRRDFSAGSALAALLAPLGAAAQSDYPNRPVKVISPFPAGGITDGIARNYTKELQDRLGQPFVLDHRPGASTNIAGAAAAAAAPDGYTLFISTLASHALNKWTYKNLAYDPEKMTTVGMMGVNAFYVVVRADSPYNSVHDLVKAARESPTPLSYGTHGEGGANHLITELFRTKAGIGKLLHVPYKGAESHRDLIAGRIDFMIDGSAISQVISGRLKALAVAYPRRWPTQPNVPTTAEVGYPDVTIATFFGLAAPPNTPAPLLDKLNQVLVEIGKDPEVEKRLLALNVLAMPATRLETEAFIRQQSDKWRPVLKSLNIAFD
jgi:tripartite-type tricarboxylate transporter receptor subunit TctC